MAEQKLTPEEIQQIKGTQDLQEKLITEFGFGEP